MPCACSSVEPCQGSCPWVKGACKGHNGPGSPYTGGSSFATHQAVCQAGGSWEQGSWCGSGAVRGLSQDLGEFSPGHTRASEPGGRCPVLKSQGGVKAISPASDPELGFCWRPSHCGHRAGHTLRQLDSILRDITPTIL